MCILRLVGFHWWMRAKEINYSYFDPTAGGSVGWRRETSGACVALVMRNVLESRWISTIAIHKHSGGWIHRVCRGKIKWMRKKRRRDFAQVEFSFPYQPQRHGSCRVSRIARSPTKTFFDRSIARRENSMRCSTQEMVM